MNDDTCQEVAKNETNQEGVDVKKATKDKKKKPNKYLAFEDLALAMCSRPSLLDVDMDNSGFAWEATMEDEQWVFINYKSRQATRASDQFTKALIREKAKTFQIIYPELFPLLPGSVNDIFSMLKELAPRLDRNLFYPLAAVGTDVGDNFVWQRVELGTGSCPTWDRVTENIATNRDAFYFWVGSLLDINAPRSRYVYLYGEGGEGKSLILNNLAKGFGKAARVSGSPHLDNRFFMSSFYRKRLAVFTDVKSYRVISSEEIKQLTGDDTIDYEFKGQMSFNAKNFVMLAFASNHAPDITSAENDARRLIHCEMKKPQSIEDESVMNERMISEWSAFVGKCHRYYVAQIEAGKKITDLMDTDAMSVAEENEAEFREIFDDWFVADEDLCFTKSQVKKLLSKSYGKEIVKPFENWLVRKFKCKFSQPRVFGIDWKEEQKCTKGFYGVGLSEVGRKWMLDNAPELVKEILRPITSQKSEIEWAALMKKVGLGPKLVAKDPIAAYKLDKKEF